MNNLSRAFPRELRSKNQEMAFTARKEIMLKNEKKKRDFCLRRTMVKQLLKDNRAINEQLCLC